MTLWPGTLSAALMILSFSAVAEVYRSVDAYGNVTFSDESTDNAETIQVKPVTTITLPKPQIVEETNKLREEVKREGSVYQSISFTYPSDNQAFHSGNGDIQFEIQSTPGLKPGHKYEVTLDGQPVGQTTSGSIVVNNVFRGTHQAQTHIIDSNGVQIKTGPAIHFTVHRPSAAN